MFDIRHASRVNAIFGSDCAPAFACGKPASDVLSLVKIKPSVVSPTSSAFGFKRFAAWASIKVKNVLPRPATSVIAQASILNAMPSANFISGNSSDIILPNGNDDIVSHNGVAVGFPFWGVSDAPLAQVHISHVFLMRSSTKMGGVYAKSVIARMQDKLTVWYRPVGDLIRKAMRQNLTTRFWVPNHAISSAIIRSKPTPALISASHSDFRPKSLLSGYDLFCHVCSIWGVCLNGKGKIKMQGYQ
jgi:hypothetical protein